MNVIQWAGKRTGALGLWDIGVLKIYCVLFGVIVGAYAANFVRDHVWWFVLLVLVLGCGFGFRWFTADPE